MKSIKVIIPIIFICMIIFASCGNNQTVDESVWDELSLDNDLSQEIEQNESSVIEYFKKNGRVDADTYIVEEHLSNNSTSIWSMSNTQPNLVSCHYKDDRGIDFYYRHYIIDNIISFNSNAYGKLDSKDVVYSSYGLVDGATYNEGDNIPISCLLIDGEFVNPTEFEGTKDLSITATSLVERLFKRIKDFGYQEIRFDGKTRTEINLLQLLPSEDDSVRQIKLKPQDDKEDHTDEKSKSSGSSFTNKYGTPTTKCAHPGCNNYIASSGDTHNCTTHSNKCLNCGKYIDEDAMYCMSCLEKSAKDVTGNNSYGSSSNNSSNSSSSSAGGPGKCKYKVGGEYVCSKPATHGNLCEEHYKYLDDTYNNLIGND